MPAAAKILTIGGLFSLLFAFIMGFVLSQERTKDHTSDQARLLGVHVVALWEGFMLLGLVWAVVLSDFSSGVETLAALLLVAGGAFQLAANFLAWKTRLVDLFAPPRGTAYKLAAINAGLAFIGLVILVIGALSGL